MATDSIGGTGESGLLLDPVKIRLSEDSTGVFVDNAAEVTYMPSQPVRLQTLYSVGTELDTTGVTTVEFVRRVVGADGLVTLTGQTILSKLDGIHPFSDGLFVPGPFTPTQALKLLLDKLKALEPWFDYETPLPEIRLPDGGSTPSLAALVIDKTAAGQTGPSARAVLTSIFEPFGYSFRVSARGRLQVVEPDWASPDPVVTLGAADVLPGGSETLDDSTVVNMCTVDSSGYAYVDGTVMRDAWIRSGAHFTAPPLPVQDVTGGTLWATTDNTLIGGTAISVEVTADVYAVGGLGDIKPDSFTGTVDVPLSGKSVTLNWNVNEGFFGGSHSTGGVTLRWTGTGIAVTASGAGNARDGLGQDWRYDWQFRLTGTGSAWAKSNVTVSARYSESDRDIPGTVESREAYGVRERKISFNVFTVDALTALRIARWTVQRSLNPATVLSVPLMMPYRIRPEHVGRTVLLPTGERALVTAWSYDESHSPGQSSSNASATVRVLRNLLAQSGELDGNIYGEDGVWGSAPYGNPASPAGVISQTPGGTGNVGLQPPEYVPPSLASTARWPAGTDPVVIVVDLQARAGIRELGYSYWADTSYSSPPATSVEISDDNVSWHALLYSPDAPNPTGYKRLYYNGSAAAIDSARYVRFTFSQLNGRVIAIGGVTVTTI